MYWYIDWQKSFIHLCVPLASYKSHWVREIRNEWYALGQAFSCLIGHKSELCLQIKCEYVCLFVPLTSVFALEFTFNWPRKACSIQTWVGASAHIHCVCVCVCGVGDSVDARTLFLRVVCCFLFNKSWHITLCQCRCRMGGFMYMCMFFGSKRQWQKSAPGLQIPKRNILASFSSISIPMNSKCNNVFAIFVGLSI